MLEDSPPFFMISHPCADQMRTKQKDELHRTPTRLCSQAGILGLAHRAGPRVECHICPQRSCLGDRPGVAGRLAAIED